MPFEILVTLRYSVNLKSEFPINYWDDVDQSECRKEKSTHLTCPYDKTVGIILQIQPIPERVYKNSQNYTRDYQRNQSFSYESKRDSRVIQLQIQIRGVVQKVESKKNPDCCHQKCTILQAFIFKTFVYQISIAVFYWTYYIYVACVCERKQ